MGFGMVNQYDVVDRALAALSRERDAVRRVRSFGPGDDREGESAVVPAAALRVRAAPARVRRDPAHRVRAGRHELD